MKGGTRAALALGAGYLLGRNRRLRTATVLAVAAATGGGGGAVKRGGKALAGSDALSKVVPQLGGITDTLRGDLITAGRAAATAAVSSRVESLSDSLHDRAEKLRDQGAAADGEAEEAEEPEEADERDEAEEADEREEAEEPAARTRRKPARGKSTVSRSRR